jgi:predicted histidine transporter YuiF (NhaC family)
MLSASAGIQQFFTESSWLMFVDLLRLIVLCMAAVIVGLALANILTRALKAWRVVGFVGVIAATYSIAVTEFDHLGKGVGPFGRLWLNFIALVAFLVMLILVWKHADHHHRI